MPTNQELVRIAVLDDYQNVVLSMANWSVLDGWRPSLCSTTTFPIPTPWSPPCSLSTSSASCASARR